MGRSTVRALAFGAIAVQVVFVVAWVVAGALDPGFSHVEDGVSALGGRDAEHPWIVNSAIVLFGLSFVAVGVALHAVLPARRARTVAVALFVATGVVTAAAGFLPVDCALSEQACEDAWRAGDSSWQHDAHLWLTVVGPPLIASLPFAIAAALRPGPVSIAAFAVGVFALALAVVGLGLGFAEVGDYGVGQRIGLFLVHGWIVIVGAGVLYTTRRPERPGRLVPVSPEDFAAPEWRGEGELTLRPLWFWGRFAQRFAARRRTHWLSDRILRVDDESDFGGGRTQARKMYCEIVSPELIRITAADLPDGAKMHVEDGGYRMTPFRMAFPLGPLPLLVRCRDESYVDPDGTFVNVTEVEDVVFHLPLARLTFRVRPVAPLDVLEEVDAQAVH
jgi:hypothetical protein